MAANPQEINLGRGLARAEQVRGATVSLQVAIRNYIDMRNMLVVQCDAIHASDPESAKLANDLGMAADYAGIQSLGMQIDTVYANLVANSNALPNALDQAAAMIR